MGHRAHDLPGYQLNELIHESSTSAVYRGRRLDDGARVIVKCSQRGLAAMRQHTRARNEYALLEAIDSNGVIDVYDLIAHDGRLFLVLEDCPGTTLKAWIDGNGATREDKLEEKLAIAAGLAEVLSDVHAAGVVHKDVNSHNVLYDPSSKRCKLIDFGIASRLKADESRVHLHGALEGTLAYIAPEQTGRTNRGVDYRADLYSLGITLYELFSGRVPFSSADPLESVHFHIAGRVTPLQQCAALPEPLSDVVMKLLEKAPERRYQSAAGLAADLRRCLERLDADGRIEPFALGADDVIDRFELPQRLYGRAPASAALAGAFGRVANGSVETVLVSGQAGVGKTSLVQEIHEPIARRKGYFAAGKFDQLQRDVPLSAFVHAMQDLVEQLLTESEDSIAGWREAIQTAIGSNGAVIVDVIPSLELIIGPQPEIPELDAFEAQNRFNLAMQGFIQVFGKKAHPLVLFLDDMQWADQASLNLVTLVLSSPATESLLVVQAFRDGELAGVHPLTMAIDEQRRLGVTVHAVPLEPLVADDVTRLVADALRVDAAAAAPLAEAVHAKTLGNPFFIGQFLDSLHDKDLIRYDGERRAFVYDLAAIEAAAITENVAELLAAKLEKLPVATRDVLRLAAAIGSRFDIDTLAAIDGRPVAAIVAALEPALADGLVIPASELESLDPDSLDSPLVHRRLDFLHDRVQHAAYGMLAEAERAATHLAIGRTLLGARDARTRESRLFDISHHLMLGEALIEDAAEKVALAEACVEAGRKAKKSTAYDLAVRSFRNAAKVLGGPGMAGRADLAPLRFEAAFRLAESLCLGNDAATALEIIAAADTGELPISDRGRLQTLKIAVYMSMGRIPDALACGRETLELMGMELPDESADVGRVLGAEIEKIRARTAEIGIERLLDLPVVDDEAVKVAMDTMTQCLPAAFQADQQLYALLCCRMVELSLDHGNCPLSARAYGSFAALLSSAVGDYADAYRFAKLGVDLGHRLNDPSVLSGVYFLWAMFASHWVRPVAESIALFQKSVQYGLQNGDHQHAAYSAARSVSHEQFKGTPLDELRATAESALELFVRIGDATNVEFVKPRLRLIDWLRGERPRGDTLGDALHDEASITAAVVERGNRSFESDWFIQLTLQRYFCGDYETAYEFARKAEELVPFSAGFVTTPEHNFYYSLTLAALATTAGRTARAAYRAKLDANLRRLEAWADQCPENLMHMCLLVRAERARIDGDTLDAMRLYDEAIAAAVQHGFVNIEAVAAERAAHFWFGAKKTDFGDLYLDRAIHAYALWGAAGKAADLGQAHRARVDEPVLATSTEKATTGGSERINALDLATVLKSSHAIAGEIRLERLLATMIEIILANAGAEFAALILKSDDDFRIQGLKTPDIDQAQVMLARPLNRSADVSRGIVNYVIRTGEEVVLAEPAKQSRFRNDEYVKGRQPKSVLCAPIVHKGELTGVIYLENNQVAGAFTPERLEALNVLLAQIAVSIENATLYARQEQQTREIEQANVALTNEIGERRRAEQELSRYKDHLEELVAKRTEELEKAQGRLVDLSRRAGMAEVAAGVLHNVGNVMNSLNVGASVTREAIRSLRVEGVAGVCDLLDAHADSIGDYIANDAAGAKIPVYLRKLGDELGRDKRSLLDKVDEVLEHLEHMKKIIAAQQSYARTTGITEVCTLAGIVETALAITQPAARIRIERDYDEMPPVLVDRHQILQILVNLLSNAKHALRSDGGDDPQIRISVTADDESCAIVVADNGVGITAENLPKVFNHGFTTKADGHGFGLHNCANAAQHMDGSLTAASDGPGRGAAFTLRLPVQYAPDGAARAEAS